MTEEHLYQQRVDYEARRHEMIRKLKRYRLVAEKMPRQLLEKDFVKEDAAFCRIADYCQRTADSFGFTENKHAREEVLAYLNRFYLRKIKARACPEIAKHNRRLLDNILAKQSGMSIFAKCDDEEELVIRNIIGESIDWHLRPKHWFDYGGGHIYYKLGWLDYLRLHPLEQYEDSQRIEYEMEGGTTKTVKELKGLDPSTAHRWFKYCLAKLEEYTKGTSQEQKVWFRKENVLTKFEALEYVYFVLDLKTIRIVVQLDCFAAEVLDSV